VAGLALGDPVGPLDGALEAVGRALAAAEPEHAARTRTRAARAAGRDIIDMAPGRPPRSDGSAGRVRLRFDNKGLDGARIFTAMSSGLRARADRARTPFRHASADPLPTRCREFVRPWRPGAEEGLERVYQDRSLTCRDCAEEFSFSAGEQAFFASKGLTNDPQRCPSCRAAAKRARSNEGPREFHAAICGACGGQAVVPFAPRNDRPVYCSSCFDKVRAGTLIESATV
jgi:CxxC-x17-CxxC domain-containing protein